MSGRNALQITDPNAVSDNPLTQGTPSFGQITYTGTMSPLDQWLSEQRAKQRQWSMNPNDMGYFRPGSARVAEPTMYDVSPIYEGQGQPSVPILSNSEQQWLDVYNSLLRSGASQQVLDYHISQNPSAALAQRIQQGKQQAGPDADVIMRAIEARQRQERK